ncbi:MAG TPA: hypothetical protein VKS60_16240, partial [Stellaceae bacterium]|nr:hypothetical protein [Stellaceae bacterium]
MPHGTYSGTYSSIALAPAYPDVTITLSGRIGASGNAVSGGTLQAYSLFNFGSITSTGGSGVDLLDGGDIVNGSASDPAALISGTIGVEISGEGTIENFGTIVGSSYAVQFLGYYADRLIIHSGAAFIGEVHAGGLGAIELASGSTEGTITGLGVHYYGFTTLDVDAGADWIAAGTNTVSGYAYIAPGATLDDTGAMTIDAGAFVENYGVLEIDGGTLLSFGAIDGPGRVILDGGGTLENLGRVAVVGATYPGVYIGLAGGTVINGGAADTTEMIQGAAGIELGGLGIVENIGTIDSTSNFGRAIYLKAGGTIVNGASGIADSLIEGYFAVVAKSGTATIENLGQILGNFGVILGGGGMVSNGVAGAPGGLIRGSKLGVLVKGAPGTVENFGTIESTDTYGVYDCGVYLRAGSST